MLQRIFIVLFILLLGSALWWPGLSGADHFAQLSEFQVLDTQSKLSDTLDWMGINLAGLRDSVSNGLDHVLEGRFFPEAELDVRHDQPMQDFFGRLWSSPYFQAFRAMLELALVRAVLALIWFAALCPILIAVCIDAWVVRRLRYESFAAHHPVLFQAALTAPPVLLTGAFTVMMLPAVIPVWVAVIFYMAFLMSIHVIVSHFHRFG